MSVLAGQSCALTGTTVEGDITVHRGGTLLALGVTVSGDVDAVGFTSVTLNGVNVAGEIRLFEGGSGQVVQSVIAGLDVRDNTGALEISGNTVSGAISCSGNVADPVGGQNEGGTRQEQCASL